MRRRQYGMMFLRSFALLGVVALVYWAGLTGPFVFDDFPALVQNTNVQVLDLSVASLAKAALSFDPGGVGRPLAMTSFALNYALNGLNPWGWKLGGLFVHMLNAWLVYLLCMRLLELAGIARFRFASAWVVALLWAVHPLQVSSVLYVVQRMETLSLTFVLLALLAYLYGRLQQRDGGRGWRWIGACVPLVILSLACKETAALFPVYTLALELTLLRFSAATVNVRKFWLWGYGVAIVASAVLFCFLVVPYYASDSHYAIRDFSAWQRVLTQFRVLPMYIKQILLPSPQWMTFYYDNIIASRSLIDPLTTLWGGAFLVTLLGFAFWLRKSMPLFALGVFWFFSAHLITSNVVPLELVFEHRNYFALLGVLLAFADLVRRISVRDGPAIKVVVVSILVLTVCFLCTLRAATWGDRLLLATELATVNPQSARAAHELGVLYYEMSNGSVRSPFFGFARHEFEREATLPHASILAEQSLILMRASHGEPVDPALWRRLHQRLRDQPITPQTTGALFGFLDNRAKGVELDDKAIDEAFLLMFEKAQLPAYSYAQAASHALHYTGDKVLARRMFLMAVDRSLEQPEYVAILVRGLRKDGQAELADEVIARAHELGIDSGG